MWALRTKILVVLIVFVLASCDSNTFEKSIRSPGLTGRSIVLEYPPIDPPVDPPEDRDWGLREGLIALYTFDGTTADLSGHAINGREKGTSYVPDRFGTNESAIHFDGSDDFITLSNSQLLKLPLPVSISMWVKLDQVDRTVASFTTDFNQNNNTGVFATFDSHGANAAFSYGDGQRLGGSSRRTRHGQTELRPDRWYHVAGVIEGFDRIDVFVNGENDFGRLDGNADSVAYSDGAANIGRRTATQGNPPIYFSGSIDELAIFNRALSSDEVYRLFSDAWLYAEGSD